MAAAPTSNLLLTTIRNVCGSTRTFGFLPPHGQTLTNGQEVTFYGDISIWLKNNARKIAALEAAISGGQLMMTQTPVPPKITYWSVDNTSVINAGDLVYYDSGSGNVKAAADFTWDTDLATTQAEFVNVFVGVAQASHANGGGALTNSFPVDISPDSLYTFTCTSETHVVGDTLGPAKAVGNALLSNKLVKSVAASSCARAEQGNSNAATSVQVRIQSAYWGQNAAGAQ